MVSPRRHNLLARRHGLGCTAFARALRAFRDDARGIAGIEFTAIAAVLMLLLVGSVEISDATRSANKARNAAATVADLTARLNVVDDGMRDTLFTTGETLAGRGAGAEITITSIATINNRNGSEEAVIIWSVSNQGEPLRTLEGIDLPTIPLGEAVIHTSVAVDYSYRFNFLSDDPVQLSYDAVRRPRFSSNVSYQN